MIWRKRKAIIGLAPASSCDSIAAVQKGKAEQKGALKTRAFIPDPSEGAMIGDKDQSGPMGQRPEPESI
jgi:hypothetical protein